LAKDKAKKKTLQKNYVNSNSIKKDYNPRILYLSLSYHTGKTKILYRILHPIRIQLLRYKLIACGFCVSIALHIHTLSANDDKILGNNPPPLADGTQVIDGSI
jgi:hypothetical protein